MIVSRVASAIVGLSLISPLHAAALSPPMLDIARQCGANSGRNTTAMSECVVAESEARSEVLQGWNALDDAAAERCIKASRKAKRLPYSALSKCMQASRGTESSHLVSGPAKRK